ncbi:hypothetical protein ACFQ3B_16880 [Stackebrandtia endophytica]|nr:hypothetical protein [Stackebrandtia endophytica]
MTEAGYPGLEDVGSFLQVIWDEVWNPIAADSPAQGSAEFAAAKQDEIALVMIHIDCDEQVGLREAYLATSSRLIDEYLIENETSLFAWYEMLTAAREATSRELS